MNGDRHIAITCPRPVARDLWGICQHHHLEDVADQIHQAATGSDSETVTIDLPKADWTFVLEASEGVREAISGVLLKENLLSGKLDTFLAE